MAWVNIPTFTSGSVLTAAQLNVLVNDMNETAPAKATSAGQHFVSTAAGTIGLRRTVSDFNSTVDTKTGTTYTNLASIGPQVSCVTGEMALVCLTSYVRNNTAGEVAFYSYAIGGATTAAADDDKALGIEPGAGAVAPAIRASAVVMQAGLTPGSNDFVTKYKVSGGTGTYDNRRIGVVPF